MNGIRPVTCDRVPPLPTARVTGAVANARVPVNGSRPQWAPMVFEKDYNCCRIVVLGKPGVGKTALTVRFITKRFIGEYCPTLESIHKCHTYLDGEDTRVELLDTAGQSADSAWTWKDYYAYWGDSYIFVYSINDRTSFEEIPNLKKQLEAVRRSKVCGILVGNKADLLHDRQVTAEEGSELADEIGCRFYEVSAADWTDVSSVKDVFQDAVREFRRTRISREIRSRRPSSSVRFRQAIQKVISGKAPAKRATPF